MQASDVHSDHPDDHESVFLPGYPTDILAVSELHNARHTFVWEADDVSSSPSAPMVLDCVCMQSALALEDLLSMMKDYDSSFEE